MISEIVRVAGQVVRLPLKKPVSLASRRVVARDWFVATVTTRDGLEGLGFSYAGYEGGQVLGAVCKELVAPIYLTRASMEPDRIGETARQQLGVQNGGLVSRAISALDIACWDRNAKAAEQPLYRFLGGTPRKIDSYVGGGYYRQADDNFDALRRELNEYVDAGYESVKVKVGKFDTNTEGRRIRICREVLGHGVDLIIDANGRFDNAEEFKLYASEYASAAPLFFEDPFPSHRLTLYDRLGTNSPIALSTGELLTNSDDFERLARSKSVSTLQIDTTACGGISAFKQISQIAKNSGLDLETHWFPELHAHLALATPHLKRIEIFHDPSIINFSTLLDDASRAAEVFDCDQAGHGLALDGVVVAAHTIHRFDSNI